MVIEHNLEVVKTADYIIDLGPEGGIHGGEIVATGAPEQIAETDRSYTGRFLRKVLYSSRSKKPEARSKNPEVGVQN